MSIVIFGDAFSFPEGNAATNRIYTYAKGFVENNISTNVICFRNDYLLTNNGTMEKIRFFNPFNQSSKNKSFFIRNWLKVLKYLNTIRIIEKINKEEKVTAILVDTHSNQTHMFSWFLAKIFGTKLIVEKSEHPLRLYQTSSFRKVRGYLKFKVESYFCDGLVCISRFLIDYYKGHGISPSKLILIPSTVDPTRFKKNGESPLQYRYIGYFGGLTMKRDNIDGLIRAFALIHEKHPDIHLVIGGFGSEKEKSAIRDLILELKISSKTLLLEYLKREEIIKYIMNSEVLVMVRGIDFETQASFPSKLTEFLATSKPVISVNVGEISDYITDGVNAFLIEPENCDELAGKMDYVLNNYELALEIAKRGNQLTSTVFNYSYQAKRILNFAEAL